MIPVVQKVLDSLAGDGLTKAGDVADKLIQDFKLPPEQKAQIQQAILNENNRHAEVVATNALAEYQTSLLDTQNARGREISVKDNTPKLLAYGVTIGFFGLLLTMIFKVLPAGNETLLNVMVGVLGTAWIAVMNYYFGSSQGSAKKSETIEKMMNGNDPNQQDSSKV